MNQLISLLIIVATVIRSVRSVEECPKITKILEKSEEIPHEDVYYGGKIYRKEKQLPQDWKTFCKSEDGNIEGCGGFVAYTKTGVYGYKNANVLGGVKENKPTMYLQKVFGPVHPTLAIYKGGLIQASYIENNLVKPMEHIPQSILDEEAEAFALVATHEDRKSYNIYMKCDLQDAWVMYHEEVIKADKQKEFDEEIKRKVEELGYFKYEELKDVLVRIPTENIPPSIATSLFTPIQSKCRNLPALPRESHQADNTVSEWYVTHVIPNNEDEPINNSLYCSAVDYFKGCGGIRVKMVKDSGITKIQTLAFHKEEETLVVYNSVPHNSDFFYRVLNGNVLGVITVNKGGKQQTHLPEDLVRKSQNREYARILGNGTSKYIFSMTCDMKEAWLMISTNAISEKDAIVEEVKKQVQELNLVDWNKLIEIPIGIPEDEYKFEG